MLVVETEAGKLQRASARCCLQDGQIRVRTPLAQVVTPRAPVWAEEIDALSRCVRARTGWMVARRRMELATRGRACARASADGCTSADLLVLPMGARVVRFGVFRDDARQKQRASGWCHASSSSVAVGGQRVPSHLARSSPEKSFSQKTDRTSRAHCKPYFICTKHVDAGTSHIHSLCCRTAAARIHYLCCLQ